MRDNFDDAILVLADCFFHRLVSQLLCADRQRYSLSNTFGSYFYRDDGHALGRVPNDFRTKLNKKLLTKSREGLE